MINILVVSMDNDGVGYYRMNAPYLTINDPELNIKLLNAGDFTFNFNEQNLKDYNVIVYHKGIPFKTQSEADNFDSIVKKYGIKIIYDIDDHWQLNSSHVNYKAWKKGNSIDITLSNIKNADFVTTTTPLFADEILPYNKNVLVAENAVNMKEQQWISNKVKSEKIRFIWGGGITHKPDLMLLQDSIKSFDPQFRKRSQLYLCGYDLRMKTENGIYVDNPERSMWTQFECIFTDNYRWVDNSNYLKWLREYTDNGRMNYGLNKDFKDEFYQRRWTKPIFTYGTMYNEADVALAPLKSGMLFNEVKSGLKIIEAGIHKCPIIASNFGAYKLDIIDGKNGYLIDENNKYEWLNKMKYLADNKNAVTDLGNSLYETVTSKYNLENINKKRIDLIKSLF